MEKGIGINGLSTIFGEPENISDYYYEMDEIWGKKWIYPGAYFIISPNGDLDFFNIDGPRFKLSVKGAILEVGKPIDALATAFPNYKDAVINGRTVNFSLKVSSGEFTDEFLSIMFDPISKKVLWMRNGMP